MITVHHLDNSRSQRILWMLEELELQYKVEYHKRDPKTLLAPASLKAVHPLGRAPVLVDGDNTLAESGAILEYLVDQYGGEKLRPKAHSPEWLRYTFWMHFAEGSAMPTLLLELIFNRIANPPIPFFVKPLILPIARGIAAQVRKMIIKPTLDRHQDYMEAELRRSTWFAGSDFSAADIQMSFVVEASASRGPMRRETHPKLFGYLDRIHARPAYKKAIEIGGPFEMLK